MTGPVQPPRSPQEPSNERTAPESLALPPEVAAPLEQDAVPGPYDGVHWPQPEPQEPRRPVLTAVQAVVVVVATVLLGLPLGVLWQRLAPDVPVLVVSDGAIYNDAQPEQFMAGDGWFAVLGIGFGVVVAVLAWVLCRQLRGLLGLAVLAVGCTAAAVLAWRTGREIGLAAYLDGLHTAVAGTHLSKPNDVRIEELRWWPPAIEGVLLVPALGSTLAVTLLAAWSRWSTLRPAADPGTPAEVAPLS